MKALWTLLILLFATSALAAPCTITGTVFNPDGTPLANGQVQFNSVVQQTLQGGAVVPPTFVTASTNASGAISAMSIVQGLQGQFTFCSPAAGGCGNPTPVLIPVALTADISAILIGIQLSTGGNVVAASLNVTNNATIGGTLVVTGPTTLTSTTTTNLTVGGPAIFNQTAVFQGTLVNFPDGSSVAPAGWNSMKAVAINQPLPPDASTGDLLSTGVYGTPTAYLALSSGMYPTAAGFKVTDPTGTVFHVVENGHELAFLMSTGLTVGAIWPGTPRTQYLALRDQAGGGPGLYLESGGIDIINGGLTVNGGALGTGILMSHYQNNATIIRSYNWDGVDISSSAIVRADNGNSVTDIGMIGPAANGGGFFNANRGYVASNSPNGLLIESTGSNGYLYLSAPNSNRVLVIGNQHFGTSNDGVSVPSANAAACGGAGSVYPTSSDTSGSVNIGPTAVNSCVVTFAASYPSVACVCSTRANTWCSITPSGSGFSMGFGANITGFASWICWENGE